MNAASPRDVLPESSRYELLVKIAAGGMATVYVGRTRASTAGVRRLFAIKRAHAHLLDDPVFRKMFVSEARLASKIHHPNVVAVQDVEELSDELLLVMDYVEGVALADLRGQITEVDPLLRLRAMTRIVLDACAGLHAAHELKGDDGKALAIVHRDVSPHNILVGSDGIARLTDFGIAKSASHTSAATATGGLKGKIGYMAPEYVETGKADRRSDVFALGAVLWEALTGERLFHAPTELEMMKLVARCEIDPPSSRNPEAPVSLDAVVARALARDPNERYATALELAEALEDSARAGNVRGSHRDVTALIEATSKDILDLRRTAVAQRIAPEADAASGDSGSFAYEGHDRTATLDPTVQAPSAAPPSSASAASSSAVSSERPSVAAPPPPASRKWQWLIAAGIALAAGAFGVSRMQSGPAPASPTSATAIAPSVTISMSTPSAAPSAAPSAVVAVQPSASAAPSVVAARPTSLPARPTATPIVTATVSAPAPSTTASAEPTPPLHAPPNPYRRDADAGAR